MGAVDVVETLGNWEKRWVFRIAFFETGLVARFFIPGVNPLCS